MYNFQILKTSFNAEMEQNNVFVYQNADLLKMHKKKS